MLACFLRNKVVSAQWRSTSYGASRCKASANTHNLNTSHRYKNPKGDGSKAHIGAQGGQCTIWTQEETSVTRMHGRKATTQRAMNEMEEEMKTGKSAWATLRKTRAQNGP